MSTGAIDLASIMVGVLVLGILGSLIATSVFVVIPWAQDRAAQSTLDAVKTAESVQIVKWTKFGDLPTLVSAGLLPNGGLNIRVGTNAAGDCYVGASRSTTGVIYYQSNTDTAPKVYTSGTSTSACTNLQTLINPMILAGGATGATPIVNLVTNPSFETALGTTITRTNLATEPQPRATGTTWSRGAGTGGAATSSVVTAPAEIPGAATAVKVAWTSPPTDTNSVYISTSSGTPLTAGATYKISIYAYYSWANPAPYLYDSPMPTNQQVVNLGGGLYRLSATVVPPSTGPYNLTPAIGGTATLPAVGSTMLASEALVELTSAVNPYFDGGSVAGGDFTYSWGGPAGSSASNQNAPQAPGIHSSINPTGPGVAGTAYQATDIVYGKVARWVAPAGTADSVWRVFEIGGTPFDQTAVLAGQTYTIMAKVRVSGWSMPRAFRLGLKRSDGLNLVTPADGTVTIDTAGAWYDLTYTFVAVANAAPDTELYGYVSNTTTPPTTVDGVMDMAGVAVIPGSYSGAIFDGSTPGAFWLGTPHASQSLRY